MAWLVYCDVPASPVADGPSGVDTSGRAPDAEVLILDHSAYDRIRIPRDGGQRSELMSITNPKWFESLMGSPIHWVAPGKIS